MSKFGNDSPNFAKMFTLPMPDSLYGACLQGITVVVFIIAKSRAWFDEYIYHDSLQARAIEGIGHLTRIKRKVCIFQQNIISA